MQASVTRCLGAQLGAWMGDPGLRIVLMWPRVKWSTVPPPHQPWGLDGVMMCVFKWGHIPTTHRPKRRPTEGEAVSTISKQEAEARWARLYEALTNFEAELIGVIETRAWEPLGYPSFTAAWADRMKGFKLTTDELKAYVVYAAVDDGLSDEEISEAVRLSEPVVSRLREQREMRVPAGLATTRVPSYDRSATNAEPSILHLQLNPVELAYYKELCGVMGRDLKTEATRAIKSHFRSLERGNARPA